MQGVAAGERRTRRLGGAKHPPFDAVASRPRQNAVQPLTGQTASAAGPRAGGTWPGARDALQRGHVSVVPRGTGLNAARSQLIPDVGRGGVVRMQGAWEQECVSGKGGGGIATTSKGPAPRLHWQGGREGMAMHITTMQAFNKFRTQAKGAQPQTQQRARVHGVNH
jgi:hypothetical protein